MIYDDEDNGILENINAQRDRKNLRTILNRGKMDKYELDQFLSNGV